MMRTQHISLDRLPPLAFSSNDKAMPRFEKRRRGVSIQDLSPFGRDQGVRPRGYVALRHLVDVVERKPYS